MNTQQIELTGISNAKGITKDEQDYITKLLSVYNDKLNNNHKQWQYYTDKHQAPNLGIAVPQKFAGMLNTSIGWAAKAVDMLAERSIFDGFIIDGERNKDLSDIILANDFKLAYEMSVPSELVHSCGFWTITAGIENDYPIIRYYNAQSAAALWDFDESRISVGFCITDYDYTSDGRLEVAKICLHTTKKVVEFSRNNNKSWYVSKRLPHNIGRPLMEAMCYLPTSNRPFGKSRVSKSVMGITDEMQREILRMALTSELYSSPTRLILGAGEEQFMTDKEKLYYNRLWNLERDEDGQLPVVEQLKQASMTPHIEVMRNLASRMAAETSVPVSSFGIIHDNPSSAEALRASMEDLCMLAESLNRCNRRALTNIAKIALAIYQKKPIDELTEEEKQVSVCFKNPYTPSIASQTDAMMKQASVASWLPETEIYWKQLGYNDEEREILLKQKKKAQAEMLVMNSISNIENANQQYPNQQQEENEELDENVNIAEKG